MDVIGKTIKKNVLVFGVGINDSEYTVRVQRKPFYVDGKKYYEQALSAGWKSKIGKGSN